MNFALYGQIAFFGIRIIVKQKISHHFTEINYCFFEYCVVFYFFT